MKFDVGSASNLGSCQALGRQETGSRRVSNVSIRTNRIIQLVVNRVGNALSHSPSTFSSYLEVTQAKERECRLVGGAM